MLRHVRSLCSPPALAAATLVLAGVAAYHRSFGGDFLLDDLSSVTNNPSIFQLWPLTAPPVGAVTGGRPVANFSFALNYALSGTAVWSYHVTNLLIHLLAALTLFGVVRRTLDQPRLRARFGAFALPLATAVALLWTVHPLQTAAVAYVSQRTEQLMALFYLLTLYCFLRGTASASRIWFPLAVAACALGMASKEVMVTAPALVLLFDRTFVAGGFYAALRARGFFYLALASTWLLLAWLVLTSHLAQRGAGFGLGISPALYFFTETRVVLGYLGLSLWPHPLIFDYGWEFAAGFAEIWPHFAALAGLVGTTAWLCWRHPVLGFPAAAFFLVLLPTSSFVPIGEQPMAESRVYLPLAAVITLLVCLGFVLLQRRIVFVVALLAIIAAVLTARRTLDYRDNVTIWTDTVDKRPANARAHRTLADALLAAGRTDDAISSYRTATRLKPDYTQAHYNLGNALFARADHPAAIAAYQTALRLSPTHVKAHNNLANALLAARDPAAAIPHYETALRLQPAFPAARHNLAVAHNDLGAAHLSAGRPADALVHFRTGLRFNPTYADLWHNLAHTLLIVGEVPEAIASARQAIHLRADFPATHVLLGNALFRTERLAEAAACYEAALRLNLNLADAHNNLGVILLRTGRLTEASAHFSTALRLQPDYPDARANLDLVERSLRP